MEFAWFVSGQTRKNVPLSPRPFKKYEKYCMLWCDIVSWRKCVLRKCVVWHAFLHMIFVLFHNNNFRPDKFYQADKSIMSN